MRTTNRCIKRSPDSPVVYLIDTNVLVYRFLDESKITNTHERQRAECARLYWRHIDSQRRAGQARVFVLDVCIAEAFKTLAKYYYKHNGVFPRSVHYKQARDRLRREVQHSPREARKSRRQVTFHDIQTSRDIIIGVDRFFEKAHKKRKNVGIVDLLLLSTARYLIDFLGFERDRIQIITMDGALYDLARMYSELPSCYNPDRGVDHPNKVFV
jgi:hypothetical protein